MRIPGDFADVLTYLTMLFAKKKMKRIEISGYSIEYNSFRILGADMSESGDNVEFPPADNVDRVSCLTFLADFHKDDPSIMISIRWDYYDFAGNVSEEEARKFIDRIDQSTFRYF